MNGADNQDPAATRPYYRLLGLRTEPGDPPGQSTLVLESRPDLENSRSDVHGGVIASLLDAAMSVAVRSALSRAHSATTVSMTINYVTAGRGTLIARGQVVRRGRTIASVEAKATDSGGNVVAHAVGTMRIIAPQADNRACALD